MAKKDDIDFSAVLDAEAAKAPAVNADESYRTIGFALNRSADMAIERLALAGFHGDQKPTKTDLIVEAINLLFEKYEVEERAQVRPRGRRS